MQYPQLDEIGIYKGMVDAIEAIPPDVGFYSPPGVKVSLLGAPPTNKPGKWRDSGAEWVKVDRKDVIDLEIKLHESKISNRMLRGSALGNQEDIDLLRGIDDKIAVLRTERAELFKG